MVAYNLIRERLEGQNNDMCSKIDGLPPIKLIDFAEILSCFSKQQREKIAAEYDMTSLIKVFGDVGMMQTIDVFLQNGMNISRTAKILYMHRNTLIYKLNSIRKQTGLDLRDFNMAATFKVLHTLYVLNNGVL